MLNDNSLAILENKVKYIEESNTALVSKRKGITYPFIYLEGVTQVEVDVYKQYTRDNPGEVPLMIKLENGFANLGSTNIDLDLLLTLSKFSERPIFIKLSKERVVPIEEVIPNMLLQKRRERK